MARLISDAERRHRLGVRHALAEPVGTPEEACAAVVALHSTDPAAMTLGVQARTGATNPDDLQRALYTDRTLVRLLTMRRTVFAVPSSQASAFLAATASSVGATQRRRTHALLVEGGVTTDPEPWLAAAEAAAHAFLRAESTGVFTTKDLAAADPLLATRMRYGTGDQVVEQSVASRLLTLWSSEGVVVRATVAGGWTSSQFRWASAEHWLGAGPTPTSPRTTAAGSLVVARGYVKRYGPVTLEDVQWWTGWTKTHARATLTALRDAGEITAVEITEGEAFVSTDDVAEVAPPAPWAALLPALDPSAMGWKHRDFSLGEHRSFVYDRNGNAGPTAWVDGRVVGGWAVRDDGTVGLALAESITTAERALLDARAAALEHFLDGAVVKPRARGWTVAEKEVRG